MSPDPRVRDDHFEKLKRACRELYQKSRKGSLKQMWNFGYRLKISKLIEVMEPNHGHPTIVGIIIERPLLVILRQELAEAVIGLAAISVVLVLLFFANPLAGFLVDALKRIDILPAGYGIVAMNGALDRLDTAFMVTAFVAFMQLIMKWIKLRKNRPILWNEGIESKKIV